MFNIDHFYGATNGSCRPTDTGPVGVGSVIYDWSCWNSAPPTMSCGFTFIAGMDPMVPAAPLGAMTAGAGVTKKNVIYRGHDDRDHNDPPKKGEGIAVFLFFFNDDSHGFIVFDNMPSPLPYR